MEKEWPNGFDGFDADNCTTIVILPVTSFRHLLDSELLGEISQRNDLEEEIGISGRIMLAHGTLRHAAPRLRFTLEIEIEW